MTQAGYFIAAALIAAIVAIYTAISQPAPLEPTRKHGRVSYVIDGDTLILEGVEQRIRLWGVDAAEQGEEGFHEARNWLVKMAEGRKVSYIEINRDRYNRIVARVFFGDGQEINRVMLKKGLVSEYCKYSKGFYDYF